MSLLLGRRQSWCIYSLLVFILSFLVPCASIAQTVNAQLSGVVKDSQGAAIAQANVTVRNTATGIVRAAKSDEEGRYQFTSLQPGPYEVTVDAENFSKKVFTGITLNVGDVEKLDAPLDVGGLSENISVVAAESLMQTQTSSNGTLVDNKQVVELPLANRQFYSLALLSPAAYQPAQNSTLGFRGGINIAGASEISNQFTINGIFDNDMGVAQPSFRPSVEVIQEFRLLTGVYPAEYGRMSGGQVVIITKSGGNQFHGSAYEFLRNEYTDARPYFTAAGAKKPSFKQNTFGATVGGPIYKDHTFFFFGYEGQRIRRAQTALATVPTTNQLNGLFTTVVNDPSTGAPLVKNAAGFYDLSRLPQWSGLAAQTGQTLLRLGFPNPTSSAASNNYTFQETRTENMNEYSARVDHKLSEKDNLSGSFNFFKDPSFEPSNTLCSSYVIPKFGCFVNQISTLVTVSYDRILTPSLLNNLRLGFQRLQQPRVQEDNTAVTNYPGLPGGPYFNQPGVTNNGGLPNVAISGYANFGGATNLPQNRWDNHYQIADTVTWTHGNHNIKAGVDLLWAISTNLITSSSRGAFTFNSSSLQSANNSAGNTTGTGSAKQIRGSTGNSLADALLGLPYTSQVGESANTVYMNFKNVNAFVQDDWKVLPNLTLNLGVRYEFDGPVYSPHNSFARFYTAGKGSFQQSGPFKGLYNPDYNNFAPRIGFSWQPFNSGSTVVKGGTGIFYNTPLLYNQFLNTGTTYPLRLVPTYTSQVTVPSNITLANPFPNVPLCGTTGGPDYSLVGTVATCAPVISPLSVNLNYRTPYITEWSFGVQQALTKSMVFETTYFGSKGTRLPLSINLNQINVNALPAGTSTSQAMRPYINYSTVSNQDTRSNSEFHSWQNSLKQSYNNGVTFILAYTWGKSIDGGGGIGSGSNSSGNPQNSYNLRAERGLSDFDVRHRLTFSPVAELPFGRGKHYLNSGPAAAILGNLQVSGIFSFQTGRPFTVSNSASNNSGSFGNADRPNVVQGQDPNAGPKTVAQWFNTSAFALAPAGRFGNLGRNTITGPKYVDLDLTLAKNFPIHERVSGQFRAESFNLLNHPNFLNPLSNGVQFGTAGFGAITQANDPRDLQFSLRILF